MSHSSTNDFYKNKENTSIGWYSIVQEYWANVEYKKVKALALQTQIWYMWFMDFF